MDESQPREDAGRSQEDLSKRGDYELRLIALIHAGDCADCSCTHLLIPVSLDIESERQAHRSAYQADKSVSVSFSDWLVSKGGTYQAPIEEIPA